MCFTFQLVQSFQVLVVFFNQFDEFGLFTKPLVANGFNVGAEIFNVVRERDDELLFGSFVVQVLFQHFQFPSITHSCIEHSPGLVSTPPVSDSPVPSLHFSLRFVFSLLRFSFQLCPSDEFSSQYCRP
uniref:Uncharacterized protein n=1 Tax=Cacopsylla melanoneura TaxID=428564 RepID=A0A8D8YSE2_9HEMI